MSFATLACSTATTLMGTCLHRPHLRTPPARVTPSATERRAKLVRPSAPSLWTRRRSAIRPPHGGAGLMRAPVTRVCAAATTHCAAAPAVARRRIRLHRRRHRRRRRRRRRRGRITRTTTPLWTATTYGALRSARKGRKGTSAGGRRWRKSAKQPAACAGSMADTGWRA